MVGLYPLSPAYLTEQDMKWLVELAESGYNKSQAVEYVSRILKGELNLWRVAGDGTEGLALTQISNTRAGRTLWIEGLVGKNMTRTYDQVWEAFERLGRMQGAAAVSGQILRPSMQRFVKKSGARTAAVVFEKELS